MSSTQPSSVLSTATLMFLPSWNALGEVATLSHTKAQTLNSWLNSWTYTDSSCHIQEGKTVIGAGVYHPSSGNSNLVEPNGAGITNTVGRAELAAITAAITHNHIHISTDSLTSLHQIRKQSLYPEKHRHHVLGDILKFLSDMFYNSQSHIFLYKGKYHAGIAGNECADSLAKYQACHGNSLPAETTIRTVGPGGNPFFDINWLAVEKVNQQGSLAISSITAQTPFLIWNTLFALKCPPAFSVHSVSKQIVLSILSQGVNMHSSQVWSLAAIMLPAGSSWKPSAKAL